MDKIERAERLEALATILEGVKEDNFNISSWADVSLTDDASETNAPIQPAHICGTSACALGYAALDPDLAKRCNIALINDRTNKVVHTIGDLANPGDDEYRQSDDFDVYFSETGDFSEGATDDFGADAGREAFGISTDTADNLFFPCAYKMRGNVSAKTVAARLRWIASMSRASDYEGNRFDFEDNRPEGFPDMPENAR